MSNVEDAKIEKDKPIENKFLTYKEGATSGALIGVVLFAALRKNIIYGGILGLVVGGYIAHGIAKSKIEGKKKVKLTYKGK